MSSSSRLDEITRALDLIRAPLALEVLDGVRNGADPYQVAPDGTDPWIIDSALDFLRTVGALAFGDLCDNDPAYTLTAMGRRLLDVLDSLDDFFDD